MPLAWKWLTVRNTSHTGCAAFAVAGEGPAAAMWLARRSVTSARDRACVAVDRHMAGHSAGFSKLLRRSVSSLGTKRIFATTERLRPPAFLALALGTGATSGTFRWGPQLLPSDARRARSRRRQRKCRLGASLSAYEIVARMAAAASPRQQTSALRGFQIKCSSSESKPRGAPCWTHLLLDPFMCAHA